MFKSKVVERQIERQIEIEKLTAENNALKALIDTLRQQQQYDKIASKLDSIVDLLKKMNEHLADICSTEPESDAPEEEHVQSDVDSIEETEKEPVEQPEEQHEEEHMRKRRKKGFTNNIIELLIRKHGPNSQYAKMVWKEEIIREMSIVLNDSYEKELLSYEQLHNIMQPVLTKYKSPSYYDQYKGYFVETGTIRVECKRLSPDGGIQKHYTIVSDNMIPKQDKKLGILEELGYDKTDVSAM